MSDFDQLSRSENESIIHEGINSCHLVDGIPSRSMLSRMSKRDLSREFGPILSSKIQSFQTKESSSDLFVFFSMVIFGHEMIIVHIVHVRMDQRYV